ncbi:MAG TPA: RNA polymerase sigma factor [Acidobacteriota bacterium]|nr:RNA polymerase sigma factor [Acidobacteriota bacterium]
MSRAGENETAPLPGRNILKGMARTDAELVAATLDGDADAFGEIVRRYQQFVFNAIYHYLGSRGDVEDVAQEVFLKLYRSLDRFDQSRPLQAWIYRITANQCLDEARKSRHRRVKTFADLGEEEEERIRRYFDENRQGASLTESEEDESLRLLQKMMDGLPEKDRMAFVLREIEGLSYAEVSQALNTSVTAARIRISRVKKKLLAQLDRILGNRQGERP